MVFLIAIIFFFVFLVPFLKFFFCVLPYLLIAKNIVERFPYFYMVILTEILLKIYCEFCVFNFDLSGQSKLVLKFIKKKTEVFRIAITEKMDFIKKKRKDSIIGSVRSHVN